MARALRQMAVLTAAAAMAATGLVVLPGNLPGTVASPSQEFTSAVEQVTAGYPRQEPLGVPEVVADDASLRLGLTAFHEIAPQVNELMASSDRVSAEVIGHSVEGRELLMLTLTAPESLDEARTQVRLREQIRTSPVEAARNPLIGQYKTPVLFMGNIHGNEWEGTDALLALAREYAESTDPAVQTLLEQTRIHLILTANPDGRVENTRQNAAGFDLNRDFLTGSQPESLAVREQIVNLQPVLMLDLHGYVNGTLIEPSTAPHAESLEYDLIIKHAYPHALAMEAAIAGLAPDQRVGVLDTQIPLRDSQDGWDDWPPIFAPQYAMAQGTIAHTIELPLRVNNGEYGRSPSQLEARSRINVDIASAAVAGSLNYLQQHRNALVQNQIEIFRRGVEGAAQRSVAGTGDLLGQRDVYLSDFPRAYVIPLGAGQRSEPAARWLAQTLIEHGVEVRQLEHQAEVGEITHPAGSFVVDMYQARRGIAQTLLGAGTDLTERVDAMYDISGWSHGLLGGADVLSVPDDASARGSRTGSANPLSDLPWSAPLTTVEASLDLPSSRTGWMLDLQDPVDLKVMNSLVDVGVEVAWLDSGSVYLPAESRDLITQAADTSVPSLRPASTLEMSRARATDSWLDDPLVVGVSGTSEEAWALEQLGFVVEEMSAKALNDGLDLDLLDTLYVSTGMSWSSLTPQAKTDVREFVADGGGLVGRGMAGVQLNQHLNLLDVTGVSGRSNANGVVAVTQGTGPLTNRTPGYAFIYAPVWFTELGREVVVEQRLAQDPLISGHWASQRSGAAGPADAGGEAVLVRGQSGPSRTVLIGTEPLFRAHPRGSHAIVGRALWWSSLG